MRPHRDATELGLTISKAIWLCLYNSKKGCCIVNVTCNIAKLHMDNIEQSMPIAVIEEGLTVVRNRIARFERDRAELDKQILADREEERLLSRLAALRRGEPSATLTGGPTQEASIHESEPARPREIAV